MACLRFDLVSVSHPHSRRSTISLNQPTEGENVAAEIPAPPELKLTTSSWETSLVGGARSPTESGRVLAC
jgi:hypothetical protein